MPLSGYQSQTYYLSKEVELLEFFYMLAATNYLMFLQGFHNTFLQWKRLTHLIQLLMFQEAQNLFQIYHSEYVIC